MVDLKGLKTAFARFASEIEFLERGELVAKLTAILVLLHSPNLWYVKIPVTILCGAALLTRSLYRNAWLWTAISLVLAIGIQITWYNIDNHKYLMLYWCIALAATCTVGNAQVLASNARFLIILCFAFATLWKFLSGTFFDGSFFTYALATDLRLREFSALLGGMTLEQLDLNQMAKSALSNSQVSEVSLTIPARVEVIGTLMTYWSFTIDVCILAAFMAPQLSRLGRLRNGLLIVFGMTTYIAVNVIAFGWVLMIMGMTQTLPDERRARLLYVVTMCAILVFATPWMTWV